MSKQCLRDNEGSNAKNFYNGLFYGKIRALLFNKFLYHLKIAYFMATKYVRKC